MPFTKPRFTWIYVIYQWFVVLGVTKWTNQRTNGSNVTGTKEIPIRGWRQVRVRNEPILIMGSYTGTQGYLRSSVGIWWAIAVGSPWKAMTHLRVRTNTHEAQNNVDVYRFVTIGGLYFISLSYNLRTSYFSLQSLYILILIFSHCFFLN